MTDGRISQKSASYSNSLVAESITPSHSYGEYLERLIARTDALREERRNARCSCNCCTRLCDECNASLDTNLQIQADVIPSMELGTTATSSETVTFHDTNVGSHAGIKRGTETSSVVDQTVNMDLVNFLSRPVRIGTFTWNESDVVGTSHTFNPWNLFFTDVRVRYKLNNFAFIQCDLVVKVLVNASPFYYGRMYMGYQPLPGLTPSTIVNDTGTRYLIPYSQRPHIWLEPQGNMGGTMNLPFFYHKNWINAQSSQDMTDMGQLTFLNYTTLQSANGVSGSGVTVTIYAHAENVRLSGPSIGLSVQSDEYGEGAISGPASAVARGASWFEDIPIIGRFATATRMGASTISSIASMFGWTNVPVISDTHPIRPEAFPQLASTQIGYPVQKLTLDPKNELTVDPTVTGLTPEDELSIIHLAQKESYLTTATWSTSNNVDDILFSSRVNPQQYDTDGATQSKVYLTPMGWLASMFDNWRGDMIFKIKIVASPFHKGRLRISYDPAGYGSENIYTDATSSNVVFTSIVDLDGDNEVEFVVPYQQATAYLANRNSAVNTSPYTTANINWSTSLSPTFGYNPLYDNGSLTIRVSTALTAPVASSSLSILVFVKAGKNFELANPVNLPCLTPLTPQSDVIETTTLGTGQSKQHEEQNLINFGESVGSLRQLLRRSSLVSVSKSPVDTTHSYVLFQKIFSKIPGMYGFDPHGINSAVGLITTGSNFPFNYSFMHPLTWILPAFVGYRGSTHWTFNATGAGTPVESMRVLRYNTPQQSNAEQVATANAGTTSADARFFFMDSWPGSSGQALTNQRTAAGLSVGCPMYTNYKFQSTAVANYTNPVSTDGSIRDQFWLEAFLSGSGAGPTPVNFTLWSYAAIGTDFGAHFFLNVPTLWAYSAIPTAN